MQTIRLKKNCQIEHLLEILIALYGISLQKAISTENGEIKPCITLYLNGRNVHTLDGLKTKLHHGDEFLILPPIEGG